MMSKEKLKTEKPADIQEEIHGKKETERGNTSAEEEPKELKPHQPPLANPADSPSKRGHGRRFTGPDTDASPETI